MRFPLPRTLSHAERCRWCRAPGKVLELEVVVGPRLVAVVCVDPITCLGRQALLVAERQRQSQPLDELGRRLAA